MFLWLQPRRVLLCDINDDLMNLYRVVREQPERLMNVLDRLHKRPHTADVYYTIRDSSWWRNTTDPIYRAARLIYLNRNCFNGLYRTNKDGQFNVPFGRYKRKPTLYDERNLLGVSALLRKAAPRTRTFDPLATLPFEEALSLTEPGDFVYLDPPYAPISKTSSFTGYANGGFSWADQERLRDCIREISLESGFSVRIMLSNSSSPQLVEMYREGEREGWCRLHEIRAPRSISARSSGRGTVKEIVVTNYLTPQV